MSKPLIAFVGFIYLAVAVSEYWNGRHGMALVFVGYAFANLGLVLA